MLPEVEENVKTGGKAESLLRLVELGFPVPEFVVIPSEKLGENGNFIQETAAAEFRRMIADQFSGNQFFAVRSSGSVEDGAQMSYAGQFLTLLNVQVKDLEEAVKKVALSTRNLLVTGYGDGRPLEMSVIVQCMLKSEVSGVAFGADPVSGARNTRVISAVWGLGEGLVSGELDADHWEVKNGSIHHHPAERKFAFRPAENGGLIKSELEENLKKRAPLSQTQILQIDAWLLQLHEFNQYYADIEFAVENGKLYLLQSRPITTLNKIPDSSGEKIIWDNSNIVESYPGLTLPLTFSFIEDVYAAVYKEFSSVMGIRNKYIHASNHIYENMLGLIYGRVYYNLNSWYGALALLPGYSLNARFMEKMMGVKEQMDVKLQKKSRFREWWDIFYAAGKILKNLRTAKKQKDQFYIDFYTVLNDPEYTGLRGKGIHALIHDFREFERVLTSKWKAPLVNDFFCMIYFGLLQKITQKAGGELQNTFHNELLSGSSDVVSAEPVKLIRRLIEAVRNDEQAKEDIIHSDARKLAVKWLHENHETAKLFSEYIEKWGDRTVAELKLETITYRMQPELLVLVLRNQLQGKWKENHSENEMRVAAERQMNLALKGKIIRKLIYSHVLRKARYFVSNRENLRYERTRGFAKVREIFIAIGNAMAAEKILDDARDIFYLRKGEIFDFAEGKSPDTDLKKLVEMRKENYLEFEKMDLPERMHSHVPVYAGLDNHRQKEAVMDGNADLCGIPCSAGMAEARVKIVKDPYSVKNMEGEILVTESTDPGWTALFATAGGILVQRGSLLSHAAIVSREMGIPCIVAIPDLLHTLHDGDRVRMDGRTGKIELIVKA